MTTATIELDIALKDRLLHLAEQRGRSLDQLGEDALESLEREEWEKARYRNAIAAWEDYKRTGLHITGGELRAWFRQLKTAPKTPPPPCHT